MLPLPRRPLPLALLLPLLAIGATAHGAAITIRPVGSSELNANTTVVATVGETVSLEVVVDTEGLTLEGYSYGLDFTGGSVSSLMLTHNALTDLIADAFGAPVIDAAAGSIRNVNQTKLTAGAGLDAGVYLLETVSFSVVSNPSGALTVSGGLFGEVFGLAESSCPGQVAGCDVSFFSAQIVPEPSTALLLALGLVVLGTAGHSGAPARPDPS